MMYDRSRPYRTVFDGLTIGSVDQLFHCEWISQKGAAIRKIGVVEVLTLHRAAETCAWVVPGLESCPETMAYDKSKSGVFRSRPLRDARA